jgi:hypothetical protein
VKARPILFSEPMIAAILAGRKTVTRRILSAVVPRETTRIVMANGADGTLYDAEREDGHCLVHSIACPYGAPGDLLWIREAHYRFGHWDPDGPKRTKAGRQKWRFVPDLSKPTRFEPPSGGFRKGRHHKDSETPAWHKRLGRFMPRTLSRLTLEVTEVRVDRGPVSDADAIAEGIRAHSEGFSWPGHKAFYPTATEAYAALFESINGPGSIAKWRWAIFFKVLP